MYQLFRRRADDFTVYIPLSYIELNRFQHSDDGELQGRDDYEDTKKVYKILHIQSDIKHMMDRRRNDTMKALNNLCPANPNITDMAGVDVMAIAHQAKIGFCREC